MPDIINGIEQENIDLLQGRVPKTVMVTEIIPKTLHDIWHICREVPVLWFSLFFNLLDPLNLKCSRYRNDLRYDL
jgi:hypothetical protein